MVWLIHWSIFYMGFALPFYRSLYRVKFFYIYILRTVTHIFEIYPYTQASRGILGVFPAKCLASWALFWARWRPIGDLKRAPSWGPSMDDEGLPPPALVCSRVCLSSFPSDLHCVYLGVTLLQAPSPRWWCLFKFCASHSLTQAKVPARFLPKEHNNTCPRLAVSCFGKEG